MKIKVLIAVLLAVSVAAGCADIRKLEELKVESLDVESVTPRGFRGVDLTLSVTVDNPGARVELSEISGVIEHSGKVLGKVAVDPFVLQGKQTGTYSLNADVTLGEGTSVLDLGRLLHKDILDEVVVDVSADVRIKKGRVRKMKLEDVPLKRLIEAVR